MPILYLIIGGMLLYVNNVSTMKKIKKEEDTGLNTLIGVILVFFITWAIVLLHN